MIAFRFLILLLAASPLTAPHAQADEKGRFYPKVTSYLDARIAEFDRVPADRREQLRRLTDYVAAQQAAGEPARMTFICTHNSRRSHLAQIWAAVAAERFGVEAVETYSGGTEATAFNPRAVEALTRAGLRIQATDESDNPRYEVRSGETVAPQAAFSKVYDELPNPTTGFCAVMTCTSADRACPTVAGASDRVAIPYEDPKAADNTPGETAKYDERSQQIAREMLFVFASLASH